MSASRDVQARLKTRTKPRALYFTINKQERQYMYNVTLRRVHITNITVEKQ